MLVPSVFWDACATCDVPRGVLFVAVVVVVANEAMEPDFPHKIKYKTRVVFCGGVLVVDFHFFFVATTAFSSFHL